MKNLLLSFIILIPHVLVAQTSFTGDGSFSDPYRGTLTGILGSPNTLIWNGPIVYADGDLTIGDYGQLIINPGTEVRFKSAGSDLKITSSGILSADGTSASPIIFTADYNNNGHGSGETWGHISFESSTGSSILDNCIIEYGYKNGSGIEGYGGGIHANTSNLIISFCQIQNNTAKFGGGIFVNKNQNPTIRNCTIKNNIASLGGGGLYFWTGSSSYVHNCVITNNSSRSTTIYGGGALYIGPSAGAVKIVHCTLADNIASFRANEVYFDISSDARIINTILWGTDKPYFGATINSFSYCAIEGGFPTGSMGCINLNSDNLNIQGPNFVSTDGTNWSLRYISPCRDAGTTPIPDVPTDFLNNSRISNYDIGAYEIQYSTWKTTAGSSDWNNAANWDGGGVPTSISEVIIPAGAANYPINSPGPDFTIGAGKEMVVKPGARVTLNNLINNGTLRLECDATGFGSLITTSYSGNNADVQLYLTGGGTPPNWHYISSPFTSLNVSYFSATQDLAQWVESMASADLSIGWVAYDGYVYRVDDAIPPNSGPTFLNLDPGKGYNHYLSTNHPYTIQGQINTTDAIMSLGCTDPGQPTRYGLNLLGNPFTSGLDWDVIANDPDNYPASTSKAIYFNKGGIIVYYVGGVGSETGVTGTIPPMQGFFTKTYSKLNTITLPATARTHLDMPSARYKGKAIIPLVRLNVSSGSYSDNAVVRFDNNAKSGPDYDYDAQKFFISASKPYIYTVSSGTKFAINGIPYPDESTEIPVVVNITTAGSNTISATQIQGLDNYPVMLIDKLVGSITDLKTNPAYPFTASSGVLTDRFVLKIGTIATGKEDLVVSAGIFNIYSSFGNIVIQTLSTEWESLKGNVRILDLAGKVMGNYANNVFSAGSLVTLPAPPDQGIYVVEIRSGLKRYVGKVVIR